MNMTPKKVMANFMAVPIYSTSGVIALAALIFVIPGGIALIGAMCLCWLADRLITIPFDDHIDTTIEEYEEFITRDPYGRSNPEIWTDFYDEEDDDDETS